MDWIDRVEEINVAAVNLAQRVIMASFRDVMIAGDVPWGCLWRHLVAFSPKKPLRSTWNRFLPW